MGRIDHEQRVVNLKLAICGPRRSGKRTVLRGLRDAIPATRRTSISGMRAKEAGKHVATTRFMSVDLLERDASHVTLSLHTLPEVRGCEAGTALRRRVLEDLDGLLFVADSSPARLGANVRALARLERDLAQAGLSDVPVVILWNKRDLPEATPLAQLRERVDLARGVDVETVAARGLGLREALRRLCEQVLTRIDLSHLVVPPAKAPAPSPTRPAAGLHQIVIAHDPKRRPTLRLSAARVAGLLLSGVLSLGTH